MEDTGGRSLSLTLHNYTLKSLQEFPYLMTARWKSTPLLPALKTTALRLPLLLLICFSSTGEPADEGSVLCLVFQVMEARLLPSAPFLLRFSGFVFPKCHPANGASSSQRECDKFCSSCPQCIRISTFETSIFPSGTHVTSLASARRDTRDTELPQQALPAYPPHLSPFDKQG